MRWSRFDGHQCGLENKRHNHEKEIFQFISPLGISESLLHHWRRAARADQSDAELEVEQLRQRLKQVEMERDILKKALALFSRQT